MKPASSCSIILYSDSLFTLIHPHSHIPQDLQHSLTSPLPPRYCAMSDMIFVTIPKFTASSTMHYVPQRFPMECSSSHPQVLSLIYLSLLASQEEVKIRLISSMCLSSMVLGRRDNHHIGHQQNIPSAVHHLLAPF